MTSPLACSLDHLKAGLPWTPNIAFGNPRDSIVIGVYLKDCTAPKADDSCCYRSPCATKTGQNHVAISPDSPSPSLNAPTTWCRVVFSYRRHKLSPQTLPRCRHFLFTVASCPVILDPSSQSIPSQPVPILFHSAASSKTDQTGLSLAANLVLRPPPDSLW